MSIETIFAASLGIYFLGALVMTSKIKYLEGNEPFETRIELDWDRYGNPQDKEVPGPAYLRVWNWPWGLLKGIALLPLNVIRLVHRIVPSRLDRQRRALMKSIPKDHLSFKDRD